MSATLTFVAAAPARTYAEGEDPFLFRRLRTWWLLLALVLLAQENAAIFSAASTASEKLRTLRQYYAPSTPIHLLFTVLLWAICAGLMVKGIGPTLRLMLNQKAVLAFAVLAFLSTLWSQDPQFTFRKASILFFVCVFAWFFAASYTPADQMRLLLAVGFTLALASIAWVVLLPQYGLDSGGEWRGVFGQKNGLGVTMLLLFSGLVFCSIPTRRRLVWVALQAILPIGLIVLSQSKESLVLAILLVAMRVSGPFVKNSRRDQLPFILFATICAVLGVIFGREIIFYLLGRDSTLTGRTHEWSIISSYALRHLWLGYGYQAFWTGTGDSLRAITRIGGGIRGSDSGYLDTMLQFGVAGILLWLIVVLVTVKDFVRLFRRNSVPFIVYWYAGLILATFVGSFVGDMFLSPTGINSFAFVVACAGLRRLRSENHNGCSAEIRLERVST